MLMNDEIMFDFYYCIISTKPHCKNEENIGVLYFYNLITFSYVWTLSLICLIQAQVNYFEHLLFVVPGNDRK